MTVPVVRIPNLPLGKMVEEDGNPTQHELTFRQTLVSSLQSNFGNEGLVAPTQNSANIAIIASNTIANPVTGQTPGSYSCQYGTMIYNSDLNEMVVAVNNGMNVPVFKQELLFDDTTVYPSAGSIAGYALTTFNGTQYKIALYALS